MSALKVCLLLGTVVYDIEDTIHMTEIVTIYTDGACSNNGTSNAKGGWAAVIIKQKEELHISGGTSGTTSSRMELQAAIEGLKSLGDSHTQVKLFTDSKYLCNGCMDWLEGWKARGWKRSNGGALLNSDLWQEIDRLLAKHTVSVEWVKAHNGDERNELADLLASRAIEQPERLTSVAK